MAWRVARSLDVLLAQFNAFAPGRSKISDGSVGDAAHASRTSDHNPWWGPGIVTARDFTHDPAHGMDIGRLSDELVATKDNRLKYVIANGLILDARPGNNPWRWVRYGGANDHRRHVHVSVMPSALADDPRPWELASFTGQPAPTPAPVTGLAPGATGDRVKQLQRVLNSWYRWLHLVTDGIYGPATTMGVREYQRRAGLAEDGIAGPLVLAKLGLA